MGQTPGSGRATKRRATHNRLAAPPRTTEELLASSSVWGVVGDSAVPQALTDGWRSYLAFEQAVAAGNVDQAVALARRLLGTWQFLLEAQDRAPRDPVDRALLVDDPLTRLARSRIRVEIVADPAGDRGIPVTKEWQEGAADVWAPSELPDGPAPVWMNNYPPRPKSITEIPPFFPWNVRLWRETIESAPSQTKPTVISAIPKRLLPPEVADQAVSRANLALEGLLDALDDARVNGLIAAARTGDTPIISAARANLAHLTLADVSRQTGVAFRDRGYTLLEATGLIMFHGAAGTVLLDEAGNPLAPGNISHYALLVPEPGSVMRRKVPNPGLYVSVNEVGFNQFKIDGRSVQKLLWGGVGAFQELLPGVGPVDHVFHERIARRVKHHEGSAYYVAAIALDMNGQEITLDRIESTLPRLQVLAVAFTVDEIRRRLKSYGNLLQAAGEEFVKELLLETVKDKVRAFLIKKVGTKIVPYVNLVFALVDLVGDDTETIRIRHAIACAIFAMRGKTSDEMTIASKVLSQIMADQFADEVVKLIVKSAMKKAAELGRRAGDEPASTPDDVGKPADSTSPPAADAGKPADASPAPTTGSTPARSEGTQRAAAPAGQPQATTTHARLGADTVVENRPVSSGGGVRTSTLKAPAATPPAGETRPATAAAAGGPPTPPPRKPGNGDDPGTGGKGNDDPGTDDPGIIRIGVDRVREEPETLMNINDGNRIGVHDRSDEAARVPRRRVEVRPGRPRTPERGGPTTIDNPEIGPPVRTAVGPVPVVVHSRHPDVLVGARTDHFEADCARVIAADRGHPMRRLLADGAAGAKPQLRDVAYGAATSRTADWQAHPEDTQMGHVRSDRTGDAEVIVLQTRYRNQKSAQERENTGDVTMDEAVVVGGIAVDRRSAEDLYSGGWIDMTPEEFANLPVIRF